MIKHMGKVKASVLLSNPAASSPQLLETDALANTGFHYLCIPEHIAQQLRLQTLEERTIVFPNGTLKSCAYVGPVEIHCLNRVCITGALVLGEEVLLGEIPLRDMNLRIHPLQKKLVVGV